MFQPTVASPTTVINPSALAIDSVREKPLSLPLIMNWLEMKPREITKLTGKKLRLTEKIACRILQQKFKNQLKRSARDPARDNSKTAFILGLIGLIGLLIPVVNFASLPLAILAIVIGSKAKRQDPQNKKARTAIKLGIITLVLLFVIGVIAALVIAFGTIHD